MATSVTAVVGEAVVGVEKMYWGTAFINERINLKALKLL